MNKQPGQNGFAAIAAIFLVVILAALGSFMLTFSNTQQLTSAQDLQGSRAYWAAHAGLEWAIGSVAASPGPAGTTEPICPTSPTTVGTNFDGGLTVVATCQRAVYIEGATAANRFIFQFSSDATTTGGSPGSVGYIQRSVSASMECVRNDPVAPAILSTYLCG
jgi:MSHA biogenesis protein MshP